MYRLTFIFSFFFCISVAMADARHDVAKIVVYKAERRMELVNGKDQPLKTYKIALGGNPVGHKTQEGDEKTPEGLYKISGRNPNSSFHRSLRVSYPNEQDKAQAEMRGVSPGGDIMIHGLRNGMGWLGRMHLLRDTWTNGCIAVTNKEIEEIWDMVSDETPVEIWP